LRQVEGERLGARTHYARPPEQDGPADLLVGDYLGGAQDLVVLALGEDDARLGDLAREKILRMT